jgi:hypothetical protein
MSFTPSPPVRAARLDALAAISGGARSVVRQPIFEID